MHQFPAHPVEPTLERVRVWDLPTRLFHWALAFCVVGAVVTAKWLDDAMAWHFRFGEAALVLLLFRLGWGLWGGHWSRFARFVERLRGWWAARRGPTSLRSAQVGHTLSGWLSTFALLAVVLAQGLSGLCADDEISVSGPWSGRVSESLVTLLTRWHRGWGQWLVLALVGLHLAALVYYRLRGRRLVAAMIDGNQPAGDAAAGVPAPAPGPLPASRDAWPQRLLAAVWALVCVFAVGAAVGWGR